MNIAKKFEFVKRNIAHGRRVEIFEWLRSTLPWQEPDPKPWIFRKSLGADGIDIFFRNEKDYFWFLLQWESELEIAKPFSDQWSLAEEFTE